MCISLCMHSIHINYYYEIHMKHIGYEAELAKGMEHFDNVLFADEYVINWNAWLTVYHDQNISKAHTNVCYTPQIFSVHYVMPFYEIKSLVLDHLRWLQINKQAWITHDQLRHTRRSNPFASNVKFITQQNHSIIIEVMAAQVVAVWFGVHVVIHFLIIYSRLLNPQNVYKGVKLFKC